MSSTPSQFVGRNAPEILVHSPDGHGSTIEGSTVGGLPQFLRYISTFPEPEALARALAMGPLLRYSTTRTSMGVLNGAELQLVSAHGYAPEVLDRYQTLPLTLSTPFAHAVTEGEVLVVPLDRLLRDYDGLSVDREIWTAIRDENGPGDVVSSPVVAEGFPIGAFGFITSGSRDWTSLDFSFIDGLSALLGLWMTHPRSRISEPAALRPVSGTPLVLSERQQMILDLVDQGKSNTAIAYTLGYSISTVKQELQRALRALRVNRRWEAVRRARELGLMPERQNAS